MEELEGKVAVVTGAASGIGLALARAFASEGMRLVLADVEEGALGVAVADFAATGSDVIGVPTDVSLAESVEALAARTEEHFGAAHVVCNNAGVATPGDPWAGPASLWEWMFAVNVWGVVNGIRAFLPMLLAQGEGHIVNTASAAGLRARPHLAPYVASKYAVVGLSESLFLDLAESAPGVGVSVLCPTWVRTRIVDGARNWLPRFGDAPTRSEEEQALHELASAALAGGADPAGIATAVIDAVRTGRFWVIPDPAVLDEVLQRADGARVGRNPSLPRL
ncbi:MAG: SDR family NAD(P)-dependent oxidoreductase, partial [Acidimicrobiia bacterium]|nr:SDR family NAD(P)-dependent oxidoreductase [Acidimicrobiia bacterium]